MVKECHENLRIVLYIHTQRGRERRGETEGEKRERSKQARATQGLVQT